MSATKPEQKREFIQFPPQAFGFVVYGVGGGAYACSFRGQPLPDFLTTLWTRLWAIRRFLNTAWNKLDKQNPGSKANIEIISKFLQIAHWAYALTLELNPFQKACVHGPTNPLYVRYIRRLEEIYTKCFAAAHVFGSADQSMVGLRGLLTDFEMNGGIDLKTGESGNGFHCTLNLCFVGHFTSDELIPALYEKFGVLIGSLSELVTTTYPKIATDLSRWIMKRLTDDYFGFGRKTVQSSAKTEMMEKLTAIAKNLLPKESAEKTA